MKLDDKQLEALLNSLPRAQISRKADKKFYARLNALARDKVNGEASEGDLGQRFFEEDMEEAPTVRNFFAFPRLAFVGAFASLLLVVGGTVWAYQPSTTRGKLMYPWKQTAEKVELAFAFSDMQKVDAHLNFSDRRLEEAQNIVGKSSSLALLLQTAFADEGEVELTGEEQKNLSATLEDMRSEVTKASEIVETRVTAPEKAKQAIERIENASNQHIETLNNLERRAAKEAKTIIRLVADDADERLTAVMQAREEINQALEKRERTVKFIINVRRERLNDDLRQRRVEEVRQNFTSAMQRFEVMPLNVKQEFTAEIEKAKASLEMGRFGMAEGLSRVMEMREMRFKLLQPEPEFLPDGQPQPQSGEKPGDTFSPVMPPDGAPLPKPELENSEKKPTDPKDIFKPLPKPDAKLPPKEQQEFLKLPDAKFPEKPAQEKPEKSDFSNSSQPKPALINNQDFQPDQQKPAEPFKKNPEAIQPPQSPPPPMPNDGKLDMMKGMERVDNLLQGLQEAGNFVEAK